MKGHVAIATAAALVGLAALAPGANATDFCTPPGAIMDVGGMFYVQIDAVLSHGYLLSVWVYMESNGEPGLQRGGANLLGDEDPCRDSANPDQAIV